MRLSRLTFIVLIFAMLSLTACAGGPPAVQTDPTPAAVNTTAPEPTKPPEPTAEPTATSEPTRASVIGIENVKSATVQIEAQGSFTDPQMGQLWNAAGRGSGFIIDPSGIAVTNNHVVTGAALLKVWVGGDTEPKNARVLGVSECWDLAVIDIEGDGYPFLDFHDGNIDPGLEVYAAGFPLGDPEYTLTKGIVSKARADGETYWASVDSVIEHDARIRGGNSGGPLVDAEGLVVGINYAGNDQLDQNYAILGKNAQNVIETLRGGSDFESIGINGQAVTSEDGTLSGIWVSSVKSGSPADKTGIEGGDIITQLEGLILATDGTMADYCDILRTRDADDTLSVEVLRFASQEYLAGQLNGDKLETSFSFANTLDQQVDDNGGTNTTGGSYDEYVTWTDSYEAIQINLPSAWGDVDGSPWELDGDIIGSSITAAASLDAFNAGYDEPGVFFGVSPYLAEYVGYIQMLDNYSSTFRKECKFLGRYDYEDAAFEGAYELFNKCGDSTSTLLVLSARPQENKTAYLVTLMVQMQSDADLAALDEMLRTFDVVGTLP